MLADFDIPRFSNDKIALQKNYLGDLILYRSLSKKRRRTSLNQYCTS